MNDDRRAIENYLLRLKEVIDALNLDEIEECVRLFRQAKEQNRTIFVFGNGGSATIASHLAGEMNCLADGKKFSVVCLNESVSSILAIGNDLAFEEVFAEQIKALARAGDLVVGASTSGNSRNVIRALDEGKKRGCTTLALCGFDGGKLKEAADYSFIVRVDDTQFTQDIHSILNHLLMRIFM